MGYFPIVVIFLFMNSFPDLTLFLILFTNSSLVKTS